MRVLLDTNILARLANRTDLQYQTARAGLGKLHRAGHELLLTPQNLIEYRSLATRPVSTNGLGFSVAQTESDIASLEARMTLLPETPDIYPAWKRVVQTLSVVGRQVYDARLIAVCQVHRVDHFLTFDVRHFTRLAGAVPPVVTVLDPRTV